MTQETPMEIHYRELGEANIKPAKVAGDWPQDFFAPRMQFGPMRSMTQNQKAAEFRRRALYSQLRALSYEKVRQAALKKTSGLRTMAFWFAIVWGAGVLAVHYNKLGDLTQGTGAITQSIGGLVSGLLGRSTQDAPF